jgi:hypothetical protein
MTELVSTGVCVAWGVIGAAYAAIWIWLGIRLYNRRERWAKWTAVALATTPALYVLSSGPMTALAWHSQSTVTCTVLPDGTEGVMAEGATDFGRWFPVAYAPLFWASEQPWGDFVFPYWEFFAFREAESEP